MGEHGDLAAVMGFVGKHVSEHGGAGGPSGRPGAARKFGDAAGGRVGERVGEHAEALGGRFLVCGGGLLDGAAAGIERGGAFEMRGGVFEPDEADIVKVREDGGDGPAGVAFGAGSGGAPSAGIKVGEEELVHGVVDGVGGEEGVANRAVECVARLSWHESLRAVILTHIENASLTRFRAWRCWLPPEMGR